MLTPKDTAKAITELRKQAGFTQKTLAEALNVTDKAVSKWERGLACPDISLLPKLSSLLDADIEALLSGVSTIDSYNWKGALVIPESDFLPDSIIYDKPMVYFLLSNFMLVGITEILAVCSKKTKESIERVLGNGEQFGLSMKFSDSSNKSVCECLLENKAFLENSNTFICYDSFFHFGASLTRNFQGFMSSKEEGIQLYDQNEEKIPFIFVTHNLWKHFFTKKHLRKSNSPDELFENALIKKHVSRGMMCIPFNSYENLNDISTFVRIYQTHHRQNIADLHEIAVRRGLITE